jgi:hypothetical protein
VTHESDNDVITEETEAAEVVEDDLRAQVAAAEAKADEHLGRPAPARGRSSTTTASASRATRS